jgi:F-type H+-transporting ATPase subunit epsilon
MARKFKVEIVTPEKLVFSEEIESLVVPAERGYLGVLAGHAPLLCTLKPGEIVMRREGGAEVRFSTAGGFMEVTPRKATLLTESAEEGSAIDAGRAEKARQRAQDRLSSADRSVDKDRARAALERAQNRLRVASKYRKP